MPQPHYETTWIDGVNNRPVKAQIRAGYRDFLVQHYTLAEARALTFAGGPVRAIHVAGSLYVYEVGSTAPDDGVNVIVTADGARYRRNSAARPLLASGTSFFVRTDGNDANNGRSNTAGGAFSTIQRVFNELSAYDLGNGIYDVFVGPGSYASAEANFFVGAATVRILGDAGSPPVIGTANVGIALLAAPGSGFHVGNCVLQGNVCLYANLGGFIFGTAGAALTFQNCNGNGIVALGRGSRVDIRSNVTIGAGIATSAFILATEQASVQWLAPTTFTVAASLNIFVHANLLSFAFIAATFTGAAFATGTRYYIQTNSVVSTAGGGANYLPGTIAGVTLTGGQYV
jgi:hypothetical protein